MSRPKLSKTLVDRLEDEGFLATYLEQKANGWTDAVIAKENGISPTVVHRFKKQVGLTGTISCRQQVNMDEYLIMKMKTRLIDEILCWKMGVSMTILLDRKKRDGICIRLNSGGSVSMDENTHRRLLSLPQGSLCEGDMHSTTLIHPKDDGRYRSRRWRATRNDSETVQREN
jgi:hypothetical protein